LYLYALSSQDIFTSKEARSAVLTLSDDDFWLTGAQVEIMRLLAGRWNEFSKEDSEALEARLAEGIPRDLFPADAFKIQERWESIWDAAVFKRLKRVSAAGGELSAASHHILDEISARHPSWMEEKVRQGPFGHPELLANITDDALVKEAIRLQRERPSKGMCGVFFVPQILTARCGRFGSKLTLASGRLRLGNPFSGPLVTRVSQSFSSSSQIYLPECLMSSSASCCRRRYRGCKSAAKRSRRTIGRADLGSSPCGTDLLP
jgi:hypothetical protein